MTNTTKKNKQKKNITLKNKKTTSIENPECYKLYKPFVKNFYNNNLVLKKELKKNHKQLMKEFVINLNSRYAPDKITPQNDFYTYINYRWLKNNEIDSIKKSKTQGYLTSFDNFKITQDKVYWQLNDILKNYVEHNNGKKSLAVKNFYSSVINLNDIHTSNKYLQDYIIYLDEMRKDKNNIWALLGLLSRNEMIKTQLPLFWEMAPNDINITKNKLHIFPVQPNILDPKAYTDDDNYYKKKYIQMCKKLFSKCLNKSYYKHYKDSYNVGVKFNNLFDCNKLKSNRNGYNLVTKTDAMEKYGFDFVSFAKALGYTKPPNSFICSDLNYLNCCSKLLMDEWNSEEWRGYWIIVFLRQLARCTKEWRTIISEFYEIIQLGQISTAVPEIRAVIFSTLPFNNLLTIEYKKLYEDKTKVEYVKGLTEDFKEVFLRIIKRNTWLSPKSKHYALKKIHALKFQISDPFYLEKDPEIEYSCKDFWQNMNKLFEWRTKKFISLDNDYITDLPLLDFNVSPPKIIGYQNYIVNASYIANRNSIYIYLGYVQEPFVDLSGKGIEYLLSELGFTIGHEISHCLDDWGSQYDEKGNLNDWWSESDKKEYKNIQNEIIKQYEDWAKRDGIIFDASISIGEDLADISGLAICDEFLMDYQLNKKYIAPVRSISFDTFYIYFAHQNRQKVERKAVNAQLISNPHPLEKYRTNVSLSRSIVFKSEFNIEKGDGMYWHNNNTVW
jgi:predicted metalloendopeptidase